MLQTILAILITGAVTYLFTIWQFKFQATHQRRMVIIEEAYEKIKLASRAYVFLASPVRTNGQQDDEVRGKDFAARADDMVAFLDTKRLFFSDEEKKHIDAINRHLRESWAEYTERKIISENPALRDRKRELEIRKKNWEDADKEIPRLIEILEDSFRKALGLEKMCWWRLFY